MEAEGRGLFQSFMPKFVLINAKYTATRQKFEKGRPTISVQI